VDFKQHSGVRGKELFLIYETVEHDANKLEQKFEREVKEIKQYLEWIRIQVKNFNDSLDSFIKQSIAQRKKKLLDDMNLVNADCYSYMNCSA